MANLKITDLKNIEYPALISLILLAASSILIPFFVHVQWITGPLVNAMLVIALVLAGLRAALVLCVVPSVIALSSGLLPLFLGPVVPFIMISNAIYVLTIDHFISSVKNKHSYWYGVFLASALKFIFLYAIANLAARYLIGPELLIKIIRMFGFSQFLTAISGGMLAWLFLVKSKL